MNYFASTLTHTLRRWSSPLFGIAVVLGVLLCTASLYAQSGAGSIQGTVTDSTGAVIPGAKIHVVNNATGSAADSTTNGVGFYQVPALFTGQYTVTITAANMKPYKQGVDLLVAQNATINAVLTAGSITQQVEVQADVVQLTTTDNGTVTSTLESSRINQLPMNVRELLFLTAETTPGMEQTGTGGEMVNGLPGEAMEFVADGVPLANRQFGGVNLGQTQLPDPDSVQEVRVETTNTPAQFSEPGTTIITTKSGTNQLHGSAFETARNNAIGIAKNRNNLATFAAPHLVRNEFGASAGGPIIIPKVYHGKDKSFWFFSYERYSLANPSTETVDVPNTQERAGDFSWYTNSSGVFQQLYDPATTGPSSSCAATPASPVNPYCRLPFGNGILQSPGNNQIPSSRLSPTMKIIFDITPLATNTSINPMEATNSGGIITNGNLTAVNPTFVMVPTITFRLDHEFNENNRAYLRYTSNVLENISLRNYTNAGLSNPATLAADGFIADATGIAVNPSASFGGAIGYTHVFSPTFFSETIVSQQWMDQHNFAGGTPFADFESKLGTPNNFGEGGFPAFGSGELLNGNWGYGGTQFIYGLSQIVSNIDENLTKTIGKHQMQFGGRYRHERFGDLPDESADQIQFNGQGTGIVTNYNPATPTVITQAPNTGGDDPDAYLGASSYYSVTQESPYAHFRDMEFDGYFQDNYHVSRNLTANLGLRWEDHPAPWTKYGLYNAFDYSRDAVVLQAPPATLISEGYTTQAIITNMQNLGAVYETPAQAGFPSVLMENYPLTFSPRVGIAYQPFGGKHGTVIRGAYGRYIYPMPTRSFLKNPMGNNPLAVGYNQNFTSSNQAYGNLPNELLRVPQGSGAWTASAATTTPYSPIMGVNSANAVNSATTNSILPGVSLWDNSKNMPPDFVTQTNFTIEQPMKGNAALRVTWLWSHGTNLDHYFYINNAPSTFLWEMMTDTAVNTANGSIATRPYDKTTWGGNTYDVKDGWSNDNALQVNYQRLFHKGIAYQVQYVWSKSFRLGGNYFRDGTVYPGANFLGYNPIAAGTSYNTTGIANFIAGGTVLTPSVPPTPPQGTLPWQEYHKLVYYQEYKPDTAIPFHHFRFNGLVDLPFGRGKRFLGNVNKFVDEAVGGWQIAGDGQILTQAFAPASGNWGAVNPIKYYRNSVKVTDCSSGHCQPEKLWYNGFIAPTSGAMGQITGLPSGYTVNSGTSPAFESPINFTGTGGTITGTNNNVNVTGPIATFSGVGYSPSPSNFGDNPYSRTILRGPWNYNVDLSLYKVFPITERVALRFNADAFNALNIQGYNNPNTTTGEIGYAPNGLSSSYWTPRQIQLTMRLQF
jgi:hypothetical protein